MDIHTNIKQAGGRYLHKSHSTPCLWRTSCCQLHYSGWVMEHMICQRQHPGHAFTERWIQFVQLHDKTSRQFLRPADSTRHRVQWMHAMHAMHAMHRSVIIPGTFSQVFTRQPDRLNGGFAWPKWRIQISVRGSVQNTKVRTDTIYTFANVIVQ